MHGTLSSQSVYFDGFSPTRMARTLTMFLYAEGGWLQRPPPVVYHEIMEQFFHQTDGFDAPIIGY